MGLPFDSKLSLQIVERFCKSISGRFTKSPYNSLSKFLRFLNHAEKGNPFDVVITDLTIPGGMGGEAAAQEILKIDPQAKIIVSSGYATNPIMANYKTHGFIGVAVKPYSIDELQNVVQQALEI